MGENSSFAIWECVEAGANCKCAICELAFLMGHNDNTRGTDNLRPKRYKICKDK